jgi:hypothetical protein
MKGYVVILLWFTSLGCHAHLLNMSRVTANLQPDKTLTVDMELDLGSALGGSDRYFEISQLQEPAKAAEMVELISALTQATRITLAGVPVPLTVISVVMPEADQESFNDTWPRTKIRLTGDAKQVVEGAPESLIAQGQFLPGFRFEEPIAFTLYDVKNDVSMTRWLAIHQKSPNFDASAWWSLESSSVNGAVKESRVAWNEILDYLKFGFLHILPFGADHLLFVLGLYLGAINLRALLILISTFTVAHSLTLIISTMGLFRLPPLIVEPIITATIVWIAVENLLVRKNAYVKTTLVFVFGLIHGMGFAGALAELGLPQESFLASLLSFNVGVEAGQIAFVAGLFALFGGLRKKAWYTPAIVKPGSVIIGVLATLWTIQRMV